MKSIANKKNSQLPSGTRINESFISKHMQSTAFPTCTTKAGWASNAPAPVMNFRIERQNVHGTRASRGLQEALKNKRHNCAFGSKNMFTRARTQRTPLLEFDKYETKN